MQAPQAHIRRGDIFWITEDDAQGAERNYAHPHVVVQDDVFTASRVDTVHVCALTTNLHKASEPGNVLLDMGEANLPKRSAVIVSQISSAKKVRLCERIGALSNERVDQIVAGLPFLQKAFLGAEPRRGRSLAWEPGGGRLGSIGQVVPRVR